MYLLEKIRLGLGVIILLLLLSMVGNIYALDYITSFTLRDVNEDGTIEQIFDEKGSPGWGSFMNAPLANTIHEFFVEFNVSDKQVSPKTYLNFDIHNPNPAGGYSQQFFIDYYMGKGTVDTSLIYNGTPLQYIPSTPPETQNYNLDITDVYNNFINSGNDYLGFRFHDPKELRWPSYGGYLEFKDGSLLINPLDLPQGSPIPNLEKPEYVCYSDAHILNLSAFAEHEDDLFDPEKPTILITHGLTGLFGNQTSDPIDEWIKPMATDIKERLELEGKKNDYNIAAWDWEKEASWLINVDLNVPFIGLPQITNMNTVLATARGQGDYLAEFLYDNNLTQGLHLIGHSAGGTLVDEVAKELYEKSSNKVDQLTFLDAPDPLINGNTANWADNYVSQLGYMHVDGAYDYYLTKQLIPLHDYAREFYKLTIDDSGYKQGFYWSSEIGGERPDINSSGYQTTDVILDQVIPKITTVVKETFDIVGNWLRSGTAFLMDGASVYEEHSSAYLFKELTIPSEVNYFNFDFKFSQLGDGDYLTVNFNDKLLFWFEGDKFYGNDFWNSSYIDISQYAGQTGTWTFALNGVGEANAKLLIDNFEFDHVDFETQNVAPIPEPSTIALFITGIIGLGAFHFKKFIT